MLVINTIFLTHTVQMKHKLEPTVYKFITIFLTHTVQMKHATFFYKC